MRGRRGLRKRLSVFRAGVVENVDEISRVLGQLVDGGESAAKNLELLLEDGEDHVVDYVCVAQD